MLQTVYNRLNLTYKSVEDSLYPSIIVRCTAIMAPEKWKPLPLADAIVSPIDSLEVLYRTKYFLNVFAVPRETCILTENVILTTEDYDATALLEKMASGVFSSYEITIILVNKRPLLIKS